MSPESPVAPFARRIVRALVGLYPPSFRRTYGDEMVELAVHRIGRAPGRWRTVGAWCRIVTDLVRGAVLEWTGSEGATGTSAGAPRGTEPTGETTMESLGQDLWNAGRRLVRTPLFSLAAVAIVALGIGANTAVFTVVDAVLLRPPPFEDPERVVRIYQDSDDGSPSSSSFPAYRDMATTEGVFSAVSATSPETVTWEAPGGPRDVLVEFTTSSHLDVVGREPALGRWFEPAHDEPGAGYYGVVSHHTWRTAMGGDPDVLGSTVRLDGRPVTLIGVGPEGYNGMGGALITDFWLSISSVEVGGAFRLANLERREDHWYDVEARLAPGVSLERARAAMDALADRLAREFPELNRDRDITVFRAGEVRVNPGVDGRLAPVAGLLLGIVGTVLLLACSNLANLLLVRGISRGPEVAVRRALGASRARVARIFLAESLLLSVAGGGVGLVLARWIVGWAEGAPAVFGVPVGLDLAMDHRVLLFTLGLVLVTGVLFGLAPALRSTRSDLAGALRTEDRSASSGRATVVLRGGLVAVQIAASVVLLVGAGLLVRSLANMESTDPGIDTEGVAYLQTTTDLPGMDRTEGALLLERARERVAALPGVSATALTTRLPLGFGGTTTRIVEGYEPSSGTGSVELPFAFVTDGYFRALGIPLLEGRVFGPDDGPDGEPVAVVNETAARRFWPGRSALGGRLRGQASDAPWLRVAGVVGDHRVARMDEPPTPMIFFSAGRGNLSEGFLIARSEGPAGGLAAALRRELAEVSPALPVSELATLESRISDALLLPRLSAGLLGGLSLLAVLLASLGVYAVVSFSVARRTAEMGIRLALGAGRKRIVGMVVVRILAVVGVGLAAGLGLALVLAPVARGVLYQVSPHDPTAFLGAAALLAAVALVAAWIPARRAARADPVEALRAR